MSPNYIEQWYKMPMIGFGTYQMPSNITKRCVLDAFIVGYRHIDTKINWRSVHGDFKLNGFYTGLRADF